MRSPSHIGQFKRDVKLAHKRGKDMDKLRKVHQVGSHTKFKHPDKPGMVTVPHPKKGMAIGTLRSIYRQAGWHWK